MMGGGFGNQSHPSSKTTNKKQHHHRGGGGGGGWFSSGSFKPENLIPGIVIGFIFGLFFDFSSKLNPTRTKRTSILSSSSKSNTHNDHDLKMVLVVRQDLKMGQGKIASQCAHAATGLYSELMQSNQNLLRRWEHCGQAKIVVTCKNQQEMNKLQETTEEIGLPTYVVADAGRTQVSAGSKTVLAIGPGYKSIVDSVTGKQRLL